VGRLFWKFFLTFWLTLLVAGFGVGTAVFLRHRAELENHITAHIPVIDAENAAALVETAESLLNYGGRAELSNFLEKLRSVHIPQVFAVDEEGNELLKRKVAPEVLSKIRNLQPQPSYQHSIRLVKLADGHSYLLFIPYPEHDFPWHATRPSLDDVGKVWLDRQPPPPGQDNNVFHHHGPPPVDHPRPSPVIPILAGIFASVLFSAGLAWYFAQPIRGLRRAFRALAQGNLNTRATHLMGQRRDELSDLGRDFDHMAEHLQALMDAQQRLLHDVSHELRSPLARIQAAVGLALQQPEKIIAMLERIERESQRMSDLIGEILVLSRIESGALNGNIHEFDIASMLDEIIDNARFEANQKAISIQYQSIPERLVKGSEELIYRAIENVVRNAVQHCESAGIVKVQADFVKSTASLHILVDDQGPGVAAGDLKAIFEPFFRSEKGFKPDSIGLGLSIAYRSIVAHGGRISASNLLAGGFRMAIVIPFTD
jgi:two-component system OmpR family sensor kinase